MSRLLQMFFFVCFLIVFSFLIGISGSFLELTRGVLGLKFKGFQDESKKDSLFGQMYRMLSETSRPAGDMKIKIYHKTI